jgi:RNA polymerase sigma-70 factor (ECF subfamily)
VNSRAPTWQPPPLDVGERHELDGTPDQRGFESVFSPLVTPALQYLPSLANFSGHGIDGGEILFQSTSGDAQPVSPETISEVFRVHSGCIRCVVLNACFTETQAREIVRHVDTVVGMRAKVADDDAISFSAGFYEALAYGCSVGRAFESAKVRLALEDKGHPDLAVLLTRGSQDASRVYLHPDAVDESLGDTSPVDRRGKLMQLEFSENFDDFSIQDRRKLQEILRLVTGDPLLRITDVAPGSIVVKIDVSETGVRRLQKLFEQGLLSAKLRMSVRQLTELLESRSLSRHLKTMSDDDLLRAWAAGDKRAEATLCHRHFESVSLYFYNKADAPDRDDLIQETFYSILNSTRSYTNFRALLFGTARFVLVKYWRETRREQLDFEVSSIADLIPSPSTLVEQSQDERILLNALQRLPLSDQLLLELHYWEGLKGREIAEALELSENSIRYRMQRARTYLHKLVQESSESPEQLESADLETWAKRIRRARPGAG